MVTAGRLVGITTCLRAGLAALCLVTSASATVFVWDGGHPAQSRWSLQQNWNPNGTPDNDGTADLVFTGSIKLSAQADVAWNLNSLRFDSAASAFTLHGSTLTINGTAMTYAIANDSSDTQTIDNVIVLAAAQTWRANTGALIFGGAIDLGSHALTFTGDADTTVDGAISGSGALTKTGAGTLTLVAANSYTGGTTVSAGTLRGTSTSLQGNITNHATVVFDQASNGTFTSVIAGSGALIKEGGSTLTLTNTNTYTGATTIHVGTLALGVASALSDDTAVSIASGATLQLAAASETVGSIAGAGAIDLGAHTLTAGGTGESTTFSGAISGTGALEKAGTGTLTLSGANTYSGGTMVSAGILRGTTTSLQGNIANEATLVFDQGTNGTFGGVVSGTGNLTKEGAGSLTLTGVNTYSGATMLSAGALVLGAANALSDNTAVTIEAGASLQLAAANETIGSLAGAGGVELGSHTLTSGGSGASTTFSGVISGSGGLVKEGGGTLTLAGANTYTGGTSVNAGTLRGTSASLVGNITTHAAVVFDQVSGGTYAGVISGSGSLTKEGAGTLTLTGSSTHTGATSIAGGAIALGASDVLSAASDLTLNSATTLALNGHSVQVGSLAYHTAIIDFGTAAAANAFLFTGGGASTGTLTINNFNAGEGDVFAFQSGASGVTGDFVSGVYFYGIGGGVLGATAQSVAGYSGTWDFIVADTTPFKSWDGGAGNNNWSSGANWSGNTAPVSSFTLKLAFDGNTRLTPVMNNSYNVNAVRFEAGAGAFTLSATGNNALTFGGSVPSIIQLSEHAQTINVPLALNSTTIIETTGAGTLTLGGVVSGTGGLTKVGAHTLVLAGDNAYSGTTTINEGTVVLRHSSALGATSSGTTVSADATLQLENNISVGAEALALDGTLRNASGTNAYGGAISGSGGVIIDGGSLSLGGSTANTYSGETTINSGTLELAKSNDITAVAGNITIGDGTNTATLRLAGNNQIADTASIVLASGTTTFNLNGRTETIGSIATDNTGASLQLASGASLTTGGDNSSTTFAGTISGTGSLTKEGSGTFTVSNANTYSGTTTINAGTFVARSSTALGSTDGGTTVASGATLQLENSISVGAESLTLQGTLRSASGTNAYAGTISGTGAVEIASGAFTLSGTGANTYTGTTTLHSGTLDLAKSAGVTALAGNLVIGDGTHAATVTLVNANQIGDASAVTLASGTTVLNLNHHSDTIGSLASANASAAVQLGAGTLTTGGNNASTTFAGVISGSGGLTKEGSGTFTLTGANTYTGDTTINAGTLLLGASDTLAGTSNVTLGSGATLALTGTNSQQIGTLNFTSATVDFGTVGTANHFVFGADGTHSGTLTIRNWTEGVDVFGVAINSVSQSFLDSVFFANVDVGIGAVLSDTPVVVGSYGSYYVLTPIPTFVWDGGQNTGNVAAQDDWTQAKNWSGDIAPATAAKKAIVLAGVAKTTTDMNAAFQVNSLLFRSDAGAFTINSSTGDTMSVGGGGINNQSEHSQTLNVSLALTANQTWTADAENLVHAGATLLNGAHTLTIAGDFDTTISADIGGGSGGIVKSGEGTLTLSGTNTYTGGTTLNAGVVSVASDANLGDASGALTFAGGTLRMTAALTSARSITLASGGGTLDTDGNDATFSGAIGGAGALTKTGEGTLTLSGSNNYSGGTTVSAGTLRGTAASLQGSIVNNAAVTFDQATSGTYAGAMSGSGSLTKEGAGTLTLSGTNSYSGGTTVDAGTLRGAAGALQGNMVNHAAVVFVQPTNATYAGVLSGSGTLTKEGDGTLTLTGANTYTGATSVVAGVLELGADQALGATSGLSVEAGAGVSLVSYAQTLGTLAGAGLIDFGTGGQLTLTGAATFAGAFAGSGELILGVGATLTLGAGFAANDLTITLAGGTLNLGGHEHSFGALNVTADSIVDFAGVSRLNIGALDFADTTLTLAIVNWVDAVDYFTTPTSPGEMGSPPLSQVVFSGFTSDTRWQEYDQQITPVPEPSTYGAWLIAGTAGWLAWRRRQRARKSRPMASGGLEG